MKIHFHGAAHGVTGSKHLIEINGKLILFDCGLYQGKRKESFERNKSFPFDASKIDAMILSHAHIDHSGNIPSLVKRGYKGKIFCTHATKDVTVFMLRDSAHIQEMDTDFFRRHKGELQPTIPIEPLYTMPDAEKALKQFEGKHYHQQFEVLPDIFCTFYDAGHILGSAVVVLDFIEDGTPKRLVFTGDLGRKSKNILKDPQSPEWADYLITESTYGDRKHEDSTRMREGLEKVVLETVQKGGNLIIPSFSMERTQEIIYDLHMLFKEKRIPEICTFVDSPLAINVTKVFADHSECYDKETKLDFLDDQKNPFSFRNLQYTLSVDESKAIARHIGPSIIISASGMCESGRIRHHLKNNVEDPKNTILIVGYQAEYTLGRRIVERRPCIKIFGEMYKLRADVRVLNGYSGHADYEELLEFIGKIDKVSHVFVVHGEPSQSAGLAKKLRSLRNNWTIEIPEPGDTLDPKQITYEGERS